MGVGGYFYFSYSILYVIFPLFNDVVSKREEASTMIKYIIRKWILKQINNLLSKYETNILTVRNTLTSWITKLELLITIFKRTLTRIEDNKLTDEEIDDTISDIEKTIREW